MPKFLSAIAAAVVIAAAAPAAAQTAAHTATNETVVSSADGTNIAITVFQPAGASATAQVPVILSSHGWAGSRWTNVSQAKSFLDAGFGVVSIDQRGHGQSGGQANVQDPDLEAEDIQTVIDRVAQLDWVQLDGPNDPVLGAVGGSYGGGYQTMTALDEIAETGSTRFNALAPEITWYDLPESLAPQRVPRTVWDTLLYAVGADMLPQYVHVAQAWGTATGQWPDGTLYGQPAPGVPNLDAEFHEHSPVAFVERGVRLDIPVLARQGITDTLFNLNEGLNIFNKAVTDEARSQSYFVGYNGGHVLPTVLPPATGTGGDACSPSTGGFTQLTIDFFRKVFANQPTDGLMPARYNLTTPEGTKCLRYDETEAKAVTVTTPTGNVITTAGAGVPQHFEIARGPLTVTGVPELSGTVASAGLDNRAFFALSIGTSPNDARIIQNNVLPLRQNLPTAGSAFKIDLPGVGVEVPEGKRLFLTVSPLSDQFAAHGSRTPGALILSNLSVLLPSPLVSAEPLATQMTLAYDGRGSKAQLVATLTETASGAGVAGAPIEFFADGTSIGTATTDSSGVATLPLDGRYRGGHYIYEATFAGNDSHAGSSASTTT